ncbi:MAG: hypothetical protein M3537_11460 [Chloroflexota bacterium]|nr:hypothetical protein [Chloroflexota bacterium]
MHLRPTRARPALMAGGVLTVAALIASTLSATAASTGPALPLLDGVTSSTDSTLDVRKATAAVAPTLAQRTSAAALLTSAGSGSRVTWDERFGTPRSLRRESGYLTGPASGTPVTVARAFLDANSAAFRLSSAEVAALAVTRDHALPGTNTHVVTFVQTFAGRSAVRGGHLTVSVTSAGRVLSYAGDPVGGGALGGAYSLSTADALLKVAGVLAPGSVSPRPRPAPRPATRCSPAAPWPARHTSRQSPSRPRTAPARHTASSS